MSTRTDILRQLSHSAPLSRAELAERLQVYPSRISRACRLLIDDGIIKEAGIKSTHDRGRKHILLDLDCSYKFALGIGFCDSLLTVGITTLKGDILGSVACECSTELIEKAYNSVKELMRESALGYDKLIGIGICAKQADIDRHFSDVAALRKAKLPIMYEAADEILAYSDNYLSINRAELFMFGCAKVIRDEFLK